MSSIIKQNVKNKKKRRKKKEKKRKKTPLCGKRTMVGIQEGEDRFGH